MHAIHQISHGAAVTVAAEEKGGIGTQLKRLGLEFVESFVHNASEPHFDCRQHCIFCVVECILVRLTVLPTITQTTPELWLKLPSESRPEIGKVVNATDISILHPAVRSAEAQRVARRQTQTPQK